MYRISSFFDVRLLIQPIRAIVLPSEYKVDEAETCCFKLLKAITRENKTIPSKQAHEGALISF
jgi:hypothetical protein